MSTAFSVLVNWRHAKKQAAEALDRSAAAVNEAIKQELFVARLLRERGPIVHNGHVYSFRDGRITCEPCVDSLLLDMEGGE